jgi:hypothetical protein
MLRNKVTTTISELQKFFTSDEKIFQTLLSVFNTLNLSGNQFRTVDKSNSKYVGYQRFVLLMLFPLFDTDLPKSGRHIEFFSRIYSHVTNSFNYGF